jgi:dipeptidase E
MKITRTSRMAISGVALFAAAALRAAGSFSTSPRASVLISGGLMMNGDHFSDSILPVMREHFAGCHSVALVLHASAPAEQDAVEKRMRMAFAEIGVPVAESLHHRDAAAAIALLRSAEGIWVTGGETFVLLAELYRTGQLGVIRSRVLAGVPYGGVSAGANVAGLLLGTTGDFSVTDIPTRAALGIFPAVINPHHPLPETKSEFDERARKIRNYLKFNPDEIVLGLANASIVRLHDGRAVVATGTAWLYRTDGVRELKKGDVVEQFAEKPSETRL